MKTYEDDSKTVKENRFPTLEFRTLLKTYMY
jgi:hypothetical protein